MKISKWPFLLQNMADNKYRSANTERRITKTQGNSKCKEGVMKRKKMEKEVVHLLEWIIEYPGVWQIVCNPDGKETSPESF